jgi:hypothetical protein
MRGEAAYSTRCSLGARLETVGFGSERELPRCAQVFPPAIKNGPWEAPLASLLGWENFLRPVSSHDAESRFHDAFFCDVFDTLV